MYSESNEGSQPGNRGRPAGRPERPGRLARAADRGSQQASSSLQQVLIWALILELISTYVRTRDHLRAAAQKLLQPVLQNHSQLASTCSTAQGGQWQPLLPQLQLNLSRRPARRRLSTPNGKSFSNSVFCRRDFRHVTFRRAVDPARARCQA